MSYYGTRDFISQSGNLDASLEWHLRTNHYPPVHPAFIPIARQAIEKGVESFDDRDCLNETIIMPNGCEKSYGDIIEGLHLQPFVDHAYAMGCETIEDSDA